MPRFILLRFLQEGSLDLVFSSVARTLPTKRNGQFRLFVLRARSALVHGIETLLYPKI